MTQTLSQLENSGAFIERHIGPDAAQQQEMLNAVGAQSLNALTGQIVPKVSSPGFWRGKKTFSPESEDYLKNPVFWEKMNNGWDEFSIPKEVARQLIDMHVRRGDAIFFVTGRSPTKTETVSKTLADNFHIPATNMNPVIFAGDKPGQNTKSQWLQDKNIRIFYGDSDNDITAARDVGARGIRILRASNSTYKPLPQAGAFGEEVIVNSEY